MPRDVRFSELKKVLLGFGYEGRRPSSGSSHWTFRKPGSPPITVPEGERLSVAYVKLVKAVIEREEGEL